MAKVYIMMLDDEPRNRGENWPKHACMQVVHIPLDMEKKVKL